MAQKLALQWSPEQISGWLKQQFPTDRDMRISHEAIYRSLFVQTRGVLKKELTAQLRTRRQMRHAKGANPDKLRELQARWFEEARKYNVLPLTIGATSGPRIRRGL